MYLAGMAKGVIPKPPGIKNFRNPAPRKFFDKPPQLKREGSSRKLDLVTIKLN